MFYVLLSMVIDVFIICSSLFFFSFLFFCADKLVVSTSCSLLHTAVDLVNETKLDKEIKSWLAFAAQKVVEVNALAKALAGHKDDVSHLCVCVCTEITRSIVAVGS